jgi:hypothetical protein
MVAAKHPSTRVRRNAGSKLTALPAEGRTGPIPVWPLKPNPFMVAELEQARDKVIQLQVDLGDADTGLAKGRVQRRLSEQQLRVSTLELRIEQAADEEIALWEWLWRTPVSTVWESSFASREVAQYVRWKVAAEQGDLKAAAEARQLSDRLGLNPLALVRLNLEIERAEEAEQRGTQRRQKAAVTPAKKSGGDPRATLRAV